MGEDSTSATYEIVIEEVSGELEVAYCEQAQESTWTDRGRRNRYNTWRQYFKQLGGMANENSSEMKPFVNN